MRVRIYVEGGGSTREQQAGCRKGFKELFRKAGLEGRMLQIVACGGREKALDDFCIALKNSEEKDFVVLLVDSEGPIEKGNGAWAHLQKSDKWEKPKAATDDNAHLMVQCMESWFLADKDELKNFFGQGFKRNALPADPNIEDIKKEDVLKGLKDATRQCAKKGKYGKGRNSFEILAKIDPAKVRQASHHANRLIETLIEKANA